MHLRIHVTIHTLVQLISFSKRGYSRTSRLQLQHTIKHTASHRNPFSTSNQCLPATQETSPAHQLPNTGCASWRDTQTTPHLVQPPDPVRLSQANDDTDSSGNRTAVQATCQPWQRTALKALACTTSQRRSPSRRRLPNNSKLPPITWHTHAESLRHQLWRSFPHAWNHLSHRVTGQYLSAGLLGINFCVILIKIQNFPFKETFWKTSSAKSSALQTTIVPGVHPTNNNIASVYSHTCILSWRYMRW